MSHDTLLTLLLLAAAALLRILNRLGRRRPSEAAIRAVKATLSCYPALNSYQAAARLTASRDGLAVALLLLNAAAKANPALYAHKVALLRAVVDASRRGEWWAERHDHPLATAYTDTYAVFVETSIGPILDLERVQISAHVSAADAATHFGDAPPANGRRWAGIPLQPRAAELAMAFLNQAKG